MTGLPILVAITHAHFDHCFGTAAFLPCPVYAHPRCAAAIRGTADRQRSRWGAHYRRIGDDRTADALAAADPPLPDREAPALLDLGGRAVELLAPGFGHTDHDLVVHVPEVRVLFAGDLVEQGGPPDLGEAVLPGWPATLDALLALNPQVVVPGHGDPVGAGFVAGQRDELARVARLRAALARGEIDVATAAAGSPYPNLQWS